MTSLECSVVQYGYLFLDEYKFNNLQGTWVHVKDQEDVRAELSLAEALCYRSGWSVLNRRHYKKSYKNDYARYMKYARKIRQLKQKNLRRLSLFGINEMPSIAWFYHSERKVEVN